MYQRCIKLLSAGALEKASWLGRQSVTPPGKQRDKWVVRVDGIDSGTGQHRPSQLGTYPSQRSATNAGRMDAMQREAASLVAGKDRLVLILGRAGAGKTEMLAAAHGLTVQGRTVFGLAPTAKAARKLEAETAIDTDTVAKLVYEWTRPERGPEPRWCLPGGTTVIVDEAGMLNTKRDCVRPRRLRRHRRRSAAAVFHLGDGDECGGELGGGRRLVCRSCRATRPQHRTRSRSATTARCELVGALWFVGRNYSPAVRRMTTPSVRARSEPPSFQSGRRPHAETMEKYAAIACRCSKAAIISSQSACETNPVSTTNVDAWRAERVKNSDWGDPPMLIGVHTSPPTSSRPALSRWSGRSRPNSASHVPVVAAASPRFIVAQSSRGVSSC